MSVNQAEKAKDNKLSESKRMARGQAAMIAVLGIAVGILSVYEKQRQVERRIAREEILQNIDENNVTIDGLRAFITHNTEIMESHRDSFDDLTNKNVTDLLEWAERARHSRRSAEVANTNAYNSVQVDRASARGNLEDEQIETETNLGSRRVEEAAANGRSRNYRRLVSSYTTEREYLQDILEHAEKDLPRLEYLERAQANGNSTDEYLSSERTRLYNNIQNQRERVNGLENILIQIYNEGREQEEERASREETAVEEQEEDT